MKHFNIRKLWIALALALALCLAAPAALPAPFLPGTNARAATAVKLNKTRATLYVGQALPLKLTGARGTVKWKSSKPAVAAVSAKGKVTAKKAGSATVTATCGKKTYKCRLTVKKGLTASVKKAEIKVGKSKAITITQKVKGKVTIKTGNAKVATAAWKGGQKVGANKLVIKAVGAGTTTVTLTNAATKETASVKVTVPNKYFVLENPSDANLTIPVFEPFFSFRNSVKVYLYADSGSEDRDLVADVADESIVECDWDYYGWLGDDYRLLYFRGQKPGTTTVKLSNSVNSETIKIKVTVTG